jgi:hypothetical protein
MTEITRDTLRAFVEDALTDAEMARVEQALRASEPLRKQLQRIVQERERGDHSIGAIWRRARLTCPSREQLGSYVLQVLDPPLQDYIDFHIRTIACPFCLANLTDLESRQHEATSQVQERRRRIYTSSAGLLPK